MHATRITKLADGEEMISFEIVERASVIEDDPRRELLEHRREVSSANPSTSDVAARSFRAASLN